MVLALPQERFEGINKDVVLVKALLEAAHLAQILIMSDLVALVVAPENDAQQAPKKGLHEPPRAPVASKRPPEASSKAASRGFQEPPGGEPS